MVSARVGSIGTIIILFCIFSVSPPLAAQEAPRTTLQAAIMAHGGEENLAKTLVGSLVAQPKFNLPSEGTASITWEETFELPRRYHRRIQGKLIEDFTLEY